MPGLTSGMRAPVRTAAGTVDLEDHRAGLVRFARQMGADANRAEDLAQETLCRALRYQAAFEQSERIHGYLRKTLQNVYINESRRASNRALSLNAIDQSGMLIPDPRMRDHSEGLIDESRRNALSRAVTRLSDEHRQVIELFYVSGLSYADIVEKTGLSEGTVKSRMFRAREALRSKLGDYV